MPRCLTAQSERFELARPFSIARGTRTAIEVVTVTLVQDGIIGMGEGAPSARYGETPDLVLAAIGSVKPAVEAGAGRAELGTLLPPGAARNAIDCALWDLEAKLTGVSIDALLGSRPGPIETAVTIVIDTPERMAAAARAVASSPLLKIKLDTGHVPERVRAVRDAAPDARLIVDANESWSPELLRRLLPELEAANVALIEQPLRAGADDALSDIASPIPIAADESAHVAGDVAALAGRYDYVTIKLDKAGGLTEALRMADTAVSCGMGLMTGCMLCTSLSIAPAWHVACRSGFVDLDGPWWLASDRENGFRFRDGRVARGSEMRGVFPNDL